MASYVASLKLCRLAQAKTAKAEETATSRAAPTLRLLTERETAALVLVVEDELEAVSWMLEGICPSTRIYEFDLSGGVDWNTNQ